MSPTESIVGALGADVFSLTSSRPEPMIQAEPSANAIAHSAIRPHSWDEVPNRITVFVYHTDGIAPVLFRDRHRRHRVGMRELSLGARLSPLAWCGG